MDPETCHMVFKDTENSASANVTNLRVEPCIGMEFDSTDAAYEVYKAYARDSGFSTRFGQLTRSKVDGSVVCRRFVCSKRGFQGHVAVGCEAYLRVKLQESGKWVIDFFQDNHNHELESIDKNVETSLTRNTLPTTSTSSVDTSQGSETSSVEVMSTEDEESEGFLNVVANSKNHASENNKVETQVEPHVGMKFDSSEDAYEFYKKYAHKSGFEIRIGKLIRSKIDHSVITRRYVCSEEGIQRSRVGCRACIRIKLQVTGEWAVDRFEKNHKHKIVVPKKDKLSHYKGLSRNRRRNRKSNIGSDWYDLLLEYFRLQQSKDPGFFYAVEVCDGRCMSIFWANSKSRFSCTQFGDVVVFDSRYRTSTHAVPFASFVGVNNHKQPVLFGCALLGDDSKEAFTWLFETWVVAMSGHHPLSIIADQDNVVRQAVKEVFPGINYRFSTWFIKAKSRENLGEVCARYKKFKLEYENCISQSETPSDFEFSWKALIKKYKLKDNDWLKEMYEEREFWVPLYLRGTYFAEVTATGSENSFFGAYLNAKTPVNEFLSGYEEAIKTRVLEAEKEDFISVHKSVKLKTKELLEKQCEKYYTRNAFFWFQEELMASYNFTAAKVFQHGPITKYVVNKNENMDEKYKVQYNCSTEDVRCQCKMFESDGMLCKHILAVFLRSEVAAVPLKYILRRWTIDAEYGIVPDLGLVHNNNHDSRTLMTWSLRKEANKYIKSGALSLDRYKAAFNILQEGRNVLLDIRKRKNKDILSDSEMVPKKLKDV